MITYRHDPWSTPSGRWRWPTTAFAIIVVPGPSVLFVISRGVTLGRRAGLATVVGNTAGLGVQLLAVTVGLGAMVQRSIVVFTMLKVAGAAYLVYLGVQALRHRRSIAHAFAAGVEQLSTRRILREGFVVGVTNPKSIVLFTAILPQFVDRSLGHVPLQLAVLGLICRGDRARQRQHVGDGLRHGSRPGWASARSAPGRDRRRRWPGHDRPRRAARAHGGAKD